MLSAISKNLYTPSIQTKEETGPVKISGSKTQAFVYSTLPLDYKTLDQMITVIGVRMGEETFGVMAHEAKIYLTLRSITDDKLLSLKKQIIDHIISNKGNLEFNFSEVDYFPATINHPEQVQDILKKLNAELLEEPMRWSEDFAYYLQEHKGAFFGIGAGEDHAGLHTSEYSYPEDLIDVTADCFYNLVK